MIDFGGEVIMRRLTILLILIWPLSAEAAGGLGISSDTIIEAALKSGYLSLEDFDVEKPDLPEIAAFGSHNDGDFTLTVHGAPTDVHQIQIFISTLTNSVGNGLTTAGDIINLIAPNHPDPDQNIAQQMPGTSRSTQWVGQNFIEIWDAWPGRGVRREWRNGNLVLIFEGTPSEFFFLTIEAFGNSRVTADVGAALADVRNFGPSADDVSPLAEFQSLADNGDEDAQFALAQASYFGHRTQKNYDEALRWYRMAAEQGHVQAQVSLGKLFPKGSGIELGPEERLRWLGNAAEQGNAEAFHELATWVFRDQRDRQEADKTFTWCQISAELGSGYGQLCLATRYWNGWGVRRDDAQAYAWATIAAAELEPGFTAMNASYLRAKYRRNLSDDQVDEAEAQAAAWTAKSYDELRPLCETDACAIWK